MEFNSCPETLIIGGGFSDLKIEKRVRIVDRGNSVRCVFYRKLLIRRLTLILLWVFFFALFPPLISDGVHSISAQCELRVLIITEDMLSSSVTVRLQNMSQEQFLSPLLADFLEGVSSVLSVAPADVFVFNVQPDAEAERVLNVSFSAALPGGQFFPSDALEEQLYLNRPRLNMLTQMQVTDTMYKTHIHWGPKKKSETTSSV